MKDSISLCEKWDGFDNQRLRYIFTPRFAPTCSAVMMKEIGRYADNHNIYIQSHLSENIDEVNQALDLFFGYRNYTEIYHRCGLLGERTIMAHCIHLQDEEFLLLKETGTRIAHCPSSNFFLKSGRFNLRKAEQYGILFGLGSDIGAGPSLSMFDIMKSMNFMQEFHILPQKSFYYATLGNARILGIDKTTGSLDEGKDADFIVVDISRAHPEFEFTGIENLLAFLIYLGNDTFVKEVYVRGAKISG